LVGQEASRKRQVQVTSFGRVRGKYQYHHLGKKPLDRRQRELVKKVEVASRVGLGLRLIGLARKRQEDQSISQSWWKSSGLVLGNVQVKVGATFLCVGSTRVMGATFLKL
jgi:hypothetical protein